MILTIEPVFTVWAKREFLKVLFRSCTSQWLDEGGGGGGGEGKDVKKKRTIRSQQEVISFLFTDSSFDEYCVKSLFGW